MVQRFQKGLNAFIERFHERWETQPSFRTTWSIMGSAVALIGLCSCMLIATNVGTKLLGSSFGAPTTKDKVIIGGANASGTNFPLPTLPPAATDSSGVPASPVATVSVEVTPTPTATPSKQTQTPTPTVTTTPSVTVTVTPTGTTIGTFTVTAQQVENPWQAGHRGHLNNIVTSPAQANQQLTISLQFGTDPNCKTNPDPLPPITLDGSGQYLASIGFNVPNCFPTGTSTVTPTYTINGTPYTPTDPAQLFTAQK